VTDEERAVEYGVVGHVATITLNRPASRNAVNGAVANGLEDAVDRIEADEDVWVAVLAARGPVFCAGADLKLLADGRGAEMYTKRGSFAGFTERARTKPVIAAVDGPALAGGFEICLSCDLIVASTAASFGLPEVKRSLIAAAGGLVRLPEVLPRNLAMELAITGAPLRAERAHHLGLVNLLTAPGEAQDRAMAFARDVTENAPLAVRHSRRVLLESALGQRDRAWELGKQLLRDLSTTEDYAEGPRAFIEKRPPRWSGR
jgi:enoyl-CoA hydratase